MVLYMLPLLVNEEKRDWPGKAVSGEREGGQGIGKLVLYSDENHSVCTFNGGWMFSSKINAGCITMSTQQLRHEQVKEEREFYRYRGVYFSSSFSWRYTRPNLSSFAL